MQDSEAVLNFWFSELEPAQWWRKDPSLDERIAQRFAALLEQASGGGCAGWRTSARGRLAEIIVLDQFSRNVFRGTPRAFAQDALALHCAQEAVALGEDQRLPLQQRAFVYMPYMHSEDAAIHQVSVRLFSQPGLEKSRVAALQHQAIVDRFGRYPHRNAILGRDSSPEETEFLTQPNSSF